FTLYPSPTRRSSDLIGAWHVELSIIVVGDRNLVLRSRIPPRAHVRREFIEPRAFLRLSVRFERRRDLLRQPGPRSDHGPAASQLDRKSTRLNSSHVK